MNLKNNVGTCKTMCPESEIREHMNQWFEIDPITKKFDPRYAIKQFHRSDAGKEILPSDVRPLPVLQKTLNHIINVVIGKLTGLTEGATEWNMALFVRDRFRSIRQDITFQKDSLKGKEIIDIYEKIAIFFLFCAVKFQDEPDFDPTQNIEQLSQTLLSLDEQYEIYFKETGKHSENEAEFRAAHLLLFITDPSFQAKLATLSNHVLESAAMKYVLDIRAAYNMQNIHKYVARALSAPLHLMCAAIASAKELWSNSLFSFRVAFRTYAMRPDFFETQLFMNPLQFEQWKPFMSIQEDKNQYKFDKSLPNIPKTVKAIIPKKFKIIVQGINFIDIFKITSSGAPPNVYIKADTYEQPIQVYREPSTPEVAEQSESSQEQATQSESEEESSHPEPEAKEIQAPQEKTPIEDEPKRTFVIPQPKQTKIAPSIISPPENQKVRLNPFLFTILSTNRKKITPAPLSIINVCPKDLSGTCFATVGVAAGDDSNSSRFAAKRFRTESPIIFCDRIDINESTLYLLIVRTDLIFTDFALGSILNCEENYCPTEDSNIPRIDFKYNETSPCFDFDASLKEAIRSAIKPIKMLDLSEILMNEGSKFMYSQYEQFKQVYSDALLSNKFRNYIVPFDHKIVTRNELKNFVNTFKVTSLEEDELIIPHFELPVDAGFDADEYFSSLSAQIIGDSSINGQSYSNRMDSLLAQFCEGLY